MEWVETTGRTIEEAKEAALDELGVDEQDAEFEVLEEPKVGLFGRLRSEGRIRARVRPTTPRAKDDRRDRRRRSKASDDAAGAEAPAATAGARSDSRAASATRSGGGATAPGRQGRPSRARPAATDAVTATADSTDTDVDGPSRLRTNPSRRRGGRSTTRPDATGPGGGASDPSESVSSVVDADIQAPVSAAPHGADDGPSSAAGTGDAAQRPASTRSRSRKRTPAKTNAASRDDGSDGEEGTLMDVALEEQGKVAEQFLLGLLDSFALPAQVAVSVPDEETIDIQVNGDDLGLLIGPKGSTLLSIQDLTRTVVQRKTNAGNGRIFIDVSGYRQKRNEALTRFAHKVAADVLASQSRIAMEPMSAPDRKTVHDAITDIEGVDTLSEGEDAMRHVVVVPVSD